MSDSRTTFRLRAVDVEFAGTPALRGIDVSVRPGEAVALIGPSGAGKTTLLRVLAGALGPSHGTASFEGQPLAELGTRALRRVRSRVGFVHQEHALVPNLRVVQNVVAGRLGQRGLLSALRSMLSPARADLERAYAILARLGIAEKLYARTDRLSGGERQRVAIARALFQGPAALLADEPVASVDPVRARATVQLFCEIAKENGLALVVSLHDFELARAYFPRLVGLRAGSVVFDGPADQLRPADVSELYALGPA